MQELTRDTVIKYKDNYFRRYLALAPLPLALERAFECDILSKKNMQRPVLDIGCGEGIFAHILFKDLIDVGIDPQQSELDRANELGAYKELICCYGDNIPKADSSFNTIISNSVLEHIPDLKPVLKEAHRLLSNSGRFYVTIPTDYFEQNTVVYRLLKLIGLNSLAQKFRIFFNNFWQHYHFYDVKAWTRYFNESGFEVVDCQQYCPVGSGVFNDLCAPFSIISFIQKKMFNKWFVYPVLRKPLAFLQFLLFNPLVDKGAKAQSGGLVFFELKKK